MSTLRLDTLIHTRYRIVQLMGQGGFGAVYEAIDERLGRRVAIKQLLHLNERISRQFEREARLLANLSHPILPRVTDQFSDASGQFLVMDFIPGDDLMALLLQRDAPFPTDQVLQWAMLLLDALHYLHNLHPPVIHRDIKPQNLKLLANGSIILLDFGLAKGFAGDLAPPASEGSFMGYTRGFAPPEQVEGTGTDARSDLYAFGCTLHCLLANTAPPEAEMRMLAVARGRPDPLRPTHTLNPQVPEAVGQVLLQAMALDRDARPASAYAMRALLEAAYGRAVPPLPVVQPQQAVRAELTEIGESTPGAASRPVIPLPTVPLPSSSQSAIGMDENAAATMARITADAPLPTTNESRAVSEEPALVLRSGAPDDSATQIAEAKPSVWRRPTVALPPFVAGLPVIGAIAAVAILITMALTISVAPQFFRAGNSPITIIATQMPVGTPAGPTLVSQTNVRPTAPSTIATAPTATAPAATAPAATAAPPSPTSTPIVAPSPPCPALQVAPETAIGCYAPDLEAALLKSGYTANNVKIDNKICLIASNSDPIRAVWSRDLDYATSGYSYVLGDMSVFRNSIELLLAGVKPDGVVPEGRFSAQKVYVYGEVPGDSWDSMPNLIHAVYVYVAKTGDHAFYEAHQETLQRIGNWIAGLDSDGDGLPDRTDFPYGYYNSVKNGVQHTYALAKFYAAFNELAELERSSGRDGSAWSTRAQQLRAGFHRPFDQGGYWRAELPWPIAWRRSDGSAVEVLETFGVFEALRSGLIGPQDGERYQQLLAALHANLPKLLDGPTPLRLALGGYEPELRRDIVPKSELWKLDASAPWIVGLAAPAYAAAGYPEDAQMLLQAYANVANATGVPRLVAGPNNRYGAGKEGGAGAWERAAWFLAVYSGHYGLTMTPDALTIQPHPFDTRSDDGIRSLNYQGATVQLALDPARGVYSVKADRPIRVLLRPMSNAKQIRVDGGALQDEVSMTLEPGREYVVASEGGR